jgi:hypothetical protein
MMASNMLYAVMLYADILYAYILYAGMLCTDLEIESAIRLYDEQHL